MHLKNFFNNLFTFSNKEKRGIIILVILIFLIILLKFVNVFELFNNNNSFSKSFFSNDTIAKLETHFFSNINKPVISYSYNDIPHDFIINPNTATTSDWKTLGLSKKQIKTINKYIAKGGKFYKISDLKKIYGINDSIYNIISTHLYIPDDEQIKAKNKIDKQYLIEINSADSTKLVELKGIGPVLASRIIKFRKKLGGFYSIFQLKEVYGIKPETFEKIKDNITADTSQIKKININEAGYHELKNHPYIGNYEAQAIIAYKKIKGKINSIVELVDNKIITDSVAKKVSYYFCFN
jgi:competence ComEA-like helix-hairpin-helix protein